MKCKKSLKNKLPKLTQEKIEYLNSSFKLVVFVADNFPAKKINKTQTQMAQVNSIKILRKTKQFYTNPSRKGYLPTHYMINITHIPKPEKDIRKENHKLVS